MAGPDKQAMGRTLLQELRQLPGEADLEYCLRTIESGATLYNVNADKDTALHLAAFYGYAEITAALIARGASLNAQNNNGHTPLMLAASLGHLDIVQQLLDAGADMALKNNNHETAADRAEATGFSSSDVLFRRQRPIIDALKTAEKVRADTAERKEMNAALDGGFPIRKPLAALKPPKFR